MERAHFAGDRRAFVSRVAGAVVVSALVATGVGVMPASAATVEATLTEGEFFNSVSPDTITATWGDTISISAPAGYWLSPPDTQEWGDPQTGAMLWGQEGVGKDGISYAELNTKVLSSGARLEIQLPVSFEDMWQRQQQRPGWGEFGAQTRAEYAAGWLENETFTLQVYRFDAANTEENTMQPVIVGLDFVASKLTFSDVAPTRPFASQILWLSESGVTNGFSDGSFRPLGSVNRDAMAAFLYRFAGQPAFTPPAESPFTDVSPSTPFYKEITWLSNTGITGGYRDGTFRPLEPVNRDAMAAFLYRFAGEPSFSAPATSPFEDVTPQTPFYKEITWLANTGVTGGYSDGTFRPLQNVARDAMAAFLFRFDDAGLRP